MSSTADPDSPDCPIEMASSKAASSSSSNRWWYVEDKDSVKKRDVVFTKPRLNGTAVSREECCRWEFKVFLNFSLHSNEKVALSGACVQLGGWNPNDSIMLLPVDGK